MDEENCSCYEGVHAFQRNFLTYFSDEKVEYLNSDEEKFVLPDDGSGGKKNFGKLVYEIDNIIC